MRYQIEFRPAARKQIHGLPRRDQVRLIRAIESLAENPRPRGVKKLSGEESLYRIRVRDYRVLYQTQDKQLVVLIVRIGHRREVYR